jgi:MFS family permease
MASDRTSPAPPTLAEQTRRRVIARLIPFLFFLYILAYVDRTNVSVAKLGMQKDPSQGGLGFGNEVIGYGAGVFFWGYWVLEIPSTLSVLRWGARWVFVRILVLWGACCILIGTIGTPWANAAFGWLPSFHPDPAVNQFYVLRFMLGFFEGGFFPSVILYLSLWFPPRDRARAIAVFMAAIPASSLLGAPVSGLMLQMDAFGIVGWRWIFILQGLAPILAAFATLFILPDGPEQAAWLRPEERAWLLAALEEEKARRATHAPAGWAAHAGVVVLLTAFYFCSTVTGYGLSMFMPSIIKSQSGLSDTWAAVVAALPFLFGLLGMLLNGWHSDRRRERVLHVALPLLGLGGSIALAAAFDGAWVWSLLIMVFLVGTFMYSHLPAFWPIPTIFLGGAAAASAIGFVNMVGNLGGSVGPILVGRAAQGQASYAPALYRLAVFPVTAATIMLLMGYLRRGALRQARGHP